MFIAISCSSINCYCRRCCSDRSIFSGSYSIVVVPIVEVWFLMKVDVQ